LIVGYCEFLAEIDIWPVMENPHMGGDFGYWMDRRGNERSGHEEKHGASHQETSLIRRFSYK
jgi:hypothetical protein